MILTMIFLPFNSRPPSTIWTPCHSVLTTTFHPWRRRCVRETQVDGSDSAHRRRDPNRQLETTKETEHRPVVSFGAGFDFYICTTLWLGSYRWWVPGDFDRE
jgi:hypothetical protein